MYNKTIDAAAVESMKKALAEVKDKHTKNATPPEDMKNNRKGKGARDMMKPADDAVKNPAVDEIDMVNKDANKMTANVKVAKNVVKKKANKGDQDIVGPGTPMPKDPAMVKPPVKENNKPRWIQDALNERSINETSVEIDESLSSWLPGAHGRYMKKLKDAYDHHVNMSKGHGEMENRIPGFGDHPDHDSDRQVMHAGCTDSHADAAEAIKQLETHAKKNKLTSHPTGEPQPRSKIRDKAGVNLLNRAKEASKNANHNTAKTIESDEINASDTTLHPDDSRVANKHMDLTAQLKKVSKTGDSGGKDSHENLR